MSIMPLFIIPLGASAFAYFATRYAVRSSARTDAQRRMATFQARWTAAITGIIAIVLVFFLFPGSQS